jgi:hypothetical protein
MNSWNCFAVFGQVSLNRDASPYIDGGRDGGAVAIGKRVHERINSLKIESSGISHRPRVGAHGSMQTAGNGNDGKGVPVRIRVIRENIQDHGRLGRQAKFIAMWGRNRIQERYRTGRRRARGIRDGVRKSIVSFEQRVTGCILQQVAFEGDKTMVGLCDAADLQRIQVVISNESGHVNVDCARFAN